jgi:hypothetical protein
VQKSGVKAKEKAKKPKSVKKKIILSRSAQPVSKHRDSACHRCFDRWRGGLGVFMPPRKNGRLRRKNKLFF